MQDSKQKTRTLTQMALLVAIILLMAFTPIGYLKVGLVEITFIMIPVVVGAILIGPGAGAILGGVFGLTSFIQCFGMSPLGAMLLQTNWFLTFVVCFVPRVLMGWLSGVIFRALYKVDKTKLVSFAVASLSGAVLNTIFFVGALGVLFHNTMLGMAGDAKVSLLTYLTSFVTINSVLECAVCLVVGTAIAKALYKSFGRQKEQR